METIKTTLIISIGAFLLGSVSLTSDIMVDTAVASSRSTFMRPVDQSHSEPDCLEGYSRLGIAKINGRRVAIYAFQNGAKLDDAASEGQGFADVFDGAGHLIRRFAFRQNLNSPPLIAEFVSLPAR